MMDRFPEAEERARMEQAPVPSKVPLPKNLTTEQKKVVVHGIDQPSIVVAGAGTGKTHTICERVAYLIECGESPQGIMMLTFTNDAAEEMRSRIASRVGAITAAKITAGTFHSVAATALRAYGWDHAEEVEGGNFRRVVTRNFRILSAPDNVDNVALAKALFDQQMSYRTDDGTNHVTPSAAKLAEIISEMDNRGIDSAARMLAYARFSKLAEGDTAWTADYIERFRVAYDQFKQTSNMMSFDDLINAYITLVRDRPQVVGHVRHVIVDEAQDMNVRQHEICDALLENLVANDSHDLMLVGDAAQSIYGWRGAEVSLFDDFADRCGAKTYHLSKNFRSQRGILELANAIMQGTPMRNVAWLSPGRKDIANFGLPDDILAKKSVHGLRTNYPEESTRPILRHIYHRPADETVAVLARTTSELRDLEATMIRRNMPYEMHGGKKFNELTCVRDAMTVMRMAACPDAVTSAEVARLLRMFNGVGDTSSSNAAKGTFPENVTRNPYRTRTSKLAEAVNGACDAILVQSTFMSQMGLKESLEAACSWYLATYEAERRKANIAYLARKNPAKTARELAEELAQEIREITGHFDTLDKIASECETFTQLDDLMSLGTPNTSDEEPEVTLSTIHSAKGLEWDTVYVMDTVDEFFPGLTNESDPKLVEQAQEEQRRCLYVAVTRAREHVVLVTSVMANVHGKTTMTTPCRYMRSPWPLKYLLSGPPGTNPNTKGW